MHPLLVTSALLACLSSTLSAANQYNDYEDSPFNYFTAEKQDPFSQLRRDVAAGTIKLPGGSPGKFVNGLLQALKITPHSQMLVFSKTAFQRRVVTSKNLRGVYFNDDTYLTYIPDGRIEVASTDPVLGSVFGIFEPTGGPEMPKIDSPNQCLGCHAGSFTNFLPGPMLRSVVADAEGRVVKDYPENNSGHGMDYGQRWGAWIVQGAPPDFPHLGNLIASHSGAEEMSDLAEPGKLAAYCAAKEMPATTSDAVALLVLDHQIAAHNKLMAAGYQWRHEVDRLQTKQRQENQPVTHTLTGDALEEAREWTRKTLHYLTFGDEKPLPATLNATTSPFAKAFPTKARRTKSGDSLREFDLSKRLFRHRLSYMVECNVVAGYPKEYRDFFWNELKAGLTAEKSPEFVQHLGAEEKQTLLQIIRETQTGLPSGF
jgi:hypothetical protein